MASTAAHSNDDERDHASPACAQQTSPLASEADFPHLVSPSASYGASYPDRPAILSPSYFASNISESGTDATAPTSNSEFNDFGFPLDRRARLSRSNSYGAAGSKSGYSSGVETPLNLGAESPGSVLNPALTPLRPLTPSAESGWQDSGIAVVQTGVPVRSRLWRSASFQRRKEDGDARRKKAIEEGREGNECGICFELPIKPRKMKCCRTVYCLEHITNWLYGPEADGRCPSCKKFFFEPSRPSTPQHPSSPKHSDTLFTQDHHNSTDDTDGDGEDDTEEEDDKWTTGSSPVEERIGRGHGEMLSAAQARPEESYGSERFISLVVLTLVLAVFIKWA